MVWESISIFHGTTVTCQGLDMERFTAELHAYDRHIPLAAVPPKAFGNIKCQQERRGMLKTNS